MSLNWKIVAVVLVLSFILREVTRSTFSPSIFQARTNVTAVDVLAELREAAIADNAVGPYVPQDELGNSTSSYVPPPFEQLSMPVPHIRSERLSVNANNLTQFLSRWVDSLLVRNETSIVPNSCQAWERKTDTAVRTASRVILTDHVSIFETIPGVDVQQLTVPHEPIFMKYPSVSRLDQAYGYPAHQEFRHTSHFRRFHGKLHKFDSSRATFPQWSGRDGPYFIAALPNTFLTFRDHILLCDNANVGMHLSSCLRSGHLLKKGRPSKVIMVPHTFPTVPVAIPLCSKGICRWGGPFHLILEHLSRLAPVAGLLKSRDDVVLAVTGDEIIEPMIFTYLSWMGVAKNKVVNIPSGIRARVVLYTPAICFRPLPFSMRVLRDVVFENLRISTHRNATPTLIFAERVSGKGSWRAPGNYAAVKSTIISLCQFVGYAHATVGDIADPNTIRDFATADVVVGVHGANLSPVIFMRPGASLVEFMARKLHPLCFYHVASLIGVEHYPVFYDFPHFHDGPPSISLMHVISQVASAMNVTSERWAQFLLERWLSKSSNASQLLVVNSSGQQVSCQLHSGAGKLFVVPRPKNTSTSSALLWCGPQLDITGNELPSTFVCQSPQHSCECSVNAALGINSPLTSAGVTLGVSSDFTSDNLTVLFWLQNSVALGCGASMPCHVTFLSLFA